MVVVAAMVVGSGGSGNGFVGSGRDEIDNNK